MEDQAANKKKEEPHGKKREHRKKKKNRKDRERKKERAESVGEQSIRRRKKKSQSAGTILSPVQEIDHMKVDRVRSLTLSDAAKERKIESAFRLWASGSGESLPEPEPISEKLVAASPFPGIPIFSEEDTSLEKRTEMKDLYQIEKAFGDWAGDAAKPKPKRTKSLNFGSIKLRGKTTSGK